MQFYRNGDRYEGQWVNSRRHGQGKIYHKYGSYFEGNFKNNKEDGIGFEHSKCGQKISQLYFKRGKLIEKSKPILK